MLYSKGVPGCNICSPSGVYKEERRKKAPMMTEQPLTQWMDAYGTEIFRLCYLCLKDYHLAQDAAVEDTMGCTTKNQVHDRGLPVDFPCR
jgi:ATP/maltotriose-dependent transcriptional regulator MalT